jgi:hypothetical protein
MAAFLIGQPHPNLGIFAGRPKKVQYGKKECSIDTQLVVQAESTHDTSVLYRDCARFGRSILALMCGVGPPKSRFATINRAGLIWKLRISGYRIKKGKLYAN